MFKKTLLALFIAGTSCSAMANWIGGVSYINLSDESDGLDLSLGGIAGSVGYKINSSTPFHFMPEIRIGTGISNDTVSMLGIDVDVEMDSFIALSLRGQYDLNNNIYLFAAPSYGNLKVTASASQGGQSFSSTDDSWEFGLGGGIGFHINEATAAEFLYEQYDGTDVLSLAIKFNF